MKLRFTITVKQGNTVPWCYIFKLVLNLFMCGRSYVFSMPYLKALNLYLLHISFHKSINPVRMFFHLYTSQLAASTQHTRSKAQSNGIPMQHRASQCCEKIKSYWKKCHIWQGKHEHEAYKGMSSRYCIPQCSSTILGMRDLKHTHLAPLTGKTNTVLKLYKQYNYWMPKCQHVKHTF